jgi:hypothetical protein
MFDEPTVGAGVQELRDDLAAGSARGCFPDHDVDFMAAAMVGAGFEVAVRMLDRDPPDVDGAVAFVTGIFLAGPQFLDCGCVPTFCRHGRLEANCPICSKKEPVSPATRTGGRRPASTSKPSTRRRSTTKAG